MKGTCSILIILATFVSLTQAQITSASNDASKVVLKTYPDFNDHQILYVLKSEDQHQEILVSKSQDIFKYIEASDIQSISVFKGESAISQFGSKAEYGAVVILFKKDKFEQLQKDLNDKLTDGK